MKDISQKTCRKLFNFFKQHIYSIGGAVIVAIIIALLAPSVTQAVSEEIVTIKPMSDSKCTFKVIERIENKTSGKLKEHKELTKNRDGNYTSIRSRKDIELISTAGTLRLITDNSFNRDTELSFMGRIRYTCSKKFDSLPDQLYMKISPGTLFLTSAVGKLGKMDSGPVTFFYQWFNDNKISVKQIPVKFNSDKQLEEKSIKKEFVSISQKHAENKLTSEQHFRFTYGVELNDGWGNGTGITLHLEEKLEIYVCEQSFFARVFSKPDLFGTCEAKLKEKYYTTLE